MKFETKNLDSGLFAVVETESQTPIVVCRRAHNAHLISTILEDDEKGSATTKVQYTAFVSK